MFKDGLRQRDIHPKDALPLSGRLIPEFNHRRSIKDMFSRRSYNNGRSSPPLITTSSNITSSTEESTNDSLRETTPSQVTTKRSHSAQDSKSPVKKLKSSGGSGKNGVQKGQQSLKGFFKPKGDVSTSTSATVDEAETLASAWRKSVPNTPTSRSISKIDEHELDTTMVHDPLERASHRTNSIMLQTEDRVVDPIVSKESWSKLFTKKPDPKCEGHEEPCIMLTTKKPGLNKGRAFWICPRPLGPSGNKEKGTQWRCGTFIWASDWNSPGWNIKSYENIWLVR